MKWIRNALVTLLRVAIREEIAAARHEDRALARELASVLEMHDKFVRREASRRARAAQNELKEHPQQENVPQGTLPFDKNALRARLLGNGRGVITHGGTTDESAQ